MSSFLLSFLPCQEKSSFLPCQGNFPPSPGRLPRQSSQGLSSFLLSFLPCQEKSSFLPPFLPRLSFSLSLSAPSINILPPLSHPLGLLYGRWQRQRQGHGQGERWGQGQRQGQRRGHGQRSWLQGLVYIGPGEGGGEEEKDLRKCVKLLYKKTVFEKSGLIPNNFFLHIFIIIFKKGFEWYKKNLVYK